MAKKKNPPDQRENCLPAATRFGLRLRLRRRTRPSLSPSPSPSVTPSSSARARKRKRKSQISKAGLKRGEGEGQTGKLLETLEVADGELLKVEPRRPFRARDAIAIYPLSHPVVCPRLVLSPQHALLAVDATASVPSQARRRRPPREVIRAGLFADERLELLRGEFWVEGRREPKEVLRIVGGGSAIRGREPGDEGWGGGGFREGVVRREPAGSGRLATDEGACFRGGGGGGRDRTAGSGNLVRGRGDGNG